MKEIAKKDLINTIDKSTEELHQNIDMHRHLMASILEQQVGDGSLINLSLPFYSPAENRLKEAIKETMEVLEESRKAFKSKRLEILRKKLTQVLIESK